MGGHGNRACAPSPQNLRRQLPPLDAFGPEDLVNLVEQERDALGLVIDLTFTTRYYKPQVSHPNGERERGSMGERKV